MDALTEQIKTYLFKKDYRRMRILYNNNPGNRDVRKAYLQILSESEKLEHRQIARTILDKGIITESDRICLVKICLFEGKYEEAKEILKNVNRREALWFLSKIACYCKDFEALEKLLIEMSHQEGLKERRYGINHLICLKVYQKKYEEAFLLTKNNKAMILPKDFNELVLFLGKELNVFVPNYEFTDLDSYLNRQLLDYKFNFALSHVEKHSKMALNKKEHSIFNLEINVRKLFEEAQSLCTEENFVCAQFLNTYAVYREGIGYDGQNYLMIVTLPNSRKVVTMYPEKTIYFEKEQEVKVMNY